MAGNEVTNLWMFDQWGQTVFQQWPPYIHISHISGQQRATGWTGIQEKAAVHSSQLPKGTWQTTRCRLEAWINYCRKLFICKLFNIVIVLFFFFFYKNSSCLIDNCCLFIQKSCLSMKLHKDLRWVYHCQHDVCVAEKTSKNYCLFSLVLLKNSTFIFLNHFIWF